MRVATLTLFFVLALSLSVFVEGKKKKNPLQPFFAKEISADVKEPSGATYCNSTNSLWIICDKPSCHYIYETTLEGDLINAWEFPDSNHDDTEAVACDDINQLIYIAEEGYMRITSFVLPHFDQEDTYTVSSKGKLHLIELDHIDVNLDDFRNQPETVTSEDDDDLPGLEGLTWVVSSNSFAVANEKEPPLIISLSVAGEIQNVEYVDYPDDVSGLAYDDILDLLWVLSDQSERLYLTDLSGSTVYDYWDLPMENPEGVAVNNQVDPPVLYIVTDPSSPHGKQYISAIFGFTKPEIGSGLVYYDKNNPPPEPVECDGCDEVWDLADDLSSAFISSDHISPLSPSSESSSSSSSSSVDIETVILSVFPSFVIACFVVVFVVGLYMYLSRNHGFLFRKKWTPVDSSTSCLEEDDLLDNFNDTRFTNLSELEESFSSELSKDEANSSFGSSNDNV